MEWLIGWIGSTAIAAFALRKKFLSLSGAISAMVMGTCYFAWSSMAWFGPLLAFFFSSSLLTHWRKQGKKEAERAYAKTGARDAGQVWANGGLGLLLAAGYHFFPHPAWWYVFLGVTASVNADTWATEIGSLSRTQPRSLLNGHPVPAGTSGGVTPLGLLAAATGGLFIGASAWFCLAILPGQAVSSEISISPPGGIHLLLLGLAGGFAGALCDSWLGAHWQIMYHCPSCGRQVERHVHCGRPAVRMRGMKWMNNDTVNWLSSLVGGLTALFLA